MALTKGRITKVISSLTLSMLILTSTFPSFAISRLAEPDDYFSVFGENSHLAVAFTNTVMANAQDIYVLDNVDTSSKAFIDAVLAEMSTEGIDLVAVANKLKFKDVPDNEYYTAGVYRLVDMGVIAGYGDGRFGPNDKMTKAQFIKVVIGATIGVQPQVGKDRHYLETYMTKAYELGIVTQSEMPLASWDQPITREEMAMVLVRAMESILKEAPVSNTTPYIDNIKDYNKYSAKSQNYIAEAYAKGLIAGYPDGNFGGKDTMIRAQACTVVLRLIDPSMRVQPKVNKPYDGAVSQWTDAQFEAYMNGFINGTDNMLKDTIWEGKGYISFAIKRVSNGKIYWDYSGNEYLFPETDVPNLNAKIYTAVKNLVYNAYVNKCSVYLGWTVQIYGGSSQGNRAIRIGFDTEPITEATRVGARPSVAELPSWSLTIYEKPQTKLWLFEDASLSYDMMTKESKDKIDKLTNNYDGHYHFYWNIKSLSSTSYANEVLVSVPKLPDGNPDIRKINPVQPEMGNILRQTVHDIYGAKNGDALYNYMTSEYTNYVRIREHNAIPGSKNYQLYDANAKAGTTFRVASACERFQINTPKFFTDY